MELLVMLGSFLHSYGPDIQATTERCGKLSHGSVPFTLLIDASSPGGCARPPLTQISAARTPRGGTQGPQPRTPSPPARLPPGRPGARSGCSLASRRTTEQPSCALSPRRSTLVALLRSFAPSLPPISSSPSAAAPPPLRPLLAFCSTHRWAGITACQSDRRDHAFSRS